MWISVGAEQSRGLARGRLGTGAAGPGAGRLGLDAAAALCAAALAAPEPFGRPTAAGHGLGRLGPRLLALRRPLSRILNSIHLIIHIHIIVL